MQEINRKPRSFNFLIFSPSLPEVFLKNFREKFLSLLGIKFIGHNGETRTTKINT